jgi:hypothetical protein
MKWLFVFILLFVCTPADAEVSVEVPPYHVSAGEMITIRVYVGTPSVRDWIDVAPAGSREDHRSPAWMYLNGEKEPPATASVITDVQTRAPTQPGEYRVRVYLNDSLTVAESTLLGVK